jgi:ribosomal protein S18 acetylase RimI-like enzyme
VERCRPAEPADLDRIVALVRELHAELATLRGGEVWAAREARQAPLEPGLAALLADPSACVLVGLIDEVVVGYGALVVETLPTGARLGRITDLYVEEPARAVGVGEALADGLLAFAAAHDTVGVDAFSLPGHRATKNFFEDQGFTARALIMHRPSSRRE